MGGRLFGFQGSGTSHINTIDVGVNYTRDTTLGIDSTGPGAMAVCLYIYSSNKWVPATQQMFK
jgi:hypothetical protein